MLVEIIELFLALVGVQGLEIKGQSQRDCILQPKVALLGYLETPDRDGSNPKGVAPGAPDEHNET